MNTEKPLLLESKKALLLRIACALETIALGIRPVETNIERVSHSEMMSQADAMKQIFGSVPTPPPVDNAHVAPGCERFSPAPRGERVSSDDVEALRAVVDKQREDLKAIFGKMEYCFSSPDHCNQCEQGENLKAIFGSVPTGERCEGYAP